MFITADGAMLSESLYGLLVALSLLCAFRLLDRPGVVRGGLLGVTIGLGALARGEALLLVPLLLVPIVRQATRTPRGSGDLPGVPGRADAMDDSQRHRVPPAGHRVH